LIAISNRPSLCRFIQSSYANYKGLIVSGEYEPDFPHKLDKICMSTSDGTERNIFTKFANKTYLIAV
jgi:hypothetical protein